MICKYKIFIRPRKKLRSDSWVLYEKSRLGQDTNRDCRVKMPGSYLQEYKTKGKKELDEFLNSRRNTKIKNKEVGMVVC
jgi:hypothetical protein